MTGTAALKKAVTVIPAKETLPFNVFSNEEIKRRVAAYARVSTNDEEQLTSYKKQKKVYIRKSMKLLKKLIGILRIRITPMH